MSYYHQINRILRVMQHLCQDTLSYDCCRSQYGPEPVRQSLDSLRSAYRTIHSSKCRQTMLPLICALTLMVYCLPPWSLTCAVLLSDSLLSLQLNSWALSKLYSHHHPAEQSENDLPGTRSLEAPDRRGVETRGILSVTCHAKIRGFSTVFRGLKPGEMAWQDLVSWSPHKGHR